MLIILLQNTGMQNLGLLNSGDYIAQGKNILCRGMQFFPVISERSLNIYRNRVNHSWRGGWFHNVPACGNFISEKVWVIQLKGRGECIVIIVPRTFITLDHVNTTPRKKNTVNIDDF